MYDTIVATRVAMILAVTGLFGRTTILIPKNRTVSITKQVPPTRANLTSSRCFSAIDRIGSGNRETTVSARDTGRVYGDRVNTPVRPSARVGEDPAAHRPELEAGGEQHAEDRARDEVRDLLGHDRDERGLQAEQVPRQPQRDDVDRDADAAHQEEKSGLVVTFAAAAGVER